MKSEILVLGIILTLPCVEKAVQLFTFPPKYRTLRILTDPDVTYLYLFVYSCKQLYHIFKTSAVLIDHLFSYLA